MGSGNVKFLVGLGIGPAISVLVYYSSRTVRAKKSRNDVFNALHEIEADAELTVVEAEEKAVKTSVKVTEKVVDKVTEMKDKLTSGS